MKLFRFVLENEEKLGVVSSKLPSGATVIDMGIEAKGSYEAGIKFCEICFGNLAIVQLDTWDLDELHSFSAVEVYASDLDHSVLLSQLAGWSLEKRPFCCHRIGSSKSKSEIVYRIPLHEKC